MKQLLARSTTFNMAAAAAEETPLWRRKAEVLMWIVKRWHVRYDADDNALMCFAIKNGHLDVLQWLATQEGVRFDTCDNWAACRASKNGHLEVLQWLATQPGVFFLHVEERETRGRLKPWLRCQKQRERSVGQRSLFAMWDAWRIAPHRPLMTVRGNAKLNVWRSVPRGAVAEVLMQISPRV